MSEQSGYTSRPHRGRGRSGHFAGITRQWRPEPRQLHEVDDIMLDSVRDDSTGEIVTRRAVNTARGGGPQNNIMARSTAIPGQEAFTDNRNSSERVAEAARRYMDSTNADSVLCVLMPAHTGLFARALTAGRIQQRDAMELGLVEAQSASGGSEELTDDVGIGQPEAPAPAQPAQPVCAHCGAQTQVLMECVFASPDGMVHGCTFCNTLSHNLDQCWEFQNRSVYGQFELLVLRRGNMPPLNTAMPWTTVLRDHMANGGKRPKYFPWTLSFGRRMNNSPSPEDQEKLVAYATRRRRGGLPKDPATSDILAVGMLMGNNSIAFEVPWAAPATSTAGSAH